MKKVLIVLLVLAFAGALLIVQQTNGLKITRYTWQTNHVPQGFDGFCIAHISDLHNKRFGKNQARLVKAVEKLQPDMIALTGDFVDLQTRDLGFMEELLAGVQGIAPVYYVDGNHDPRSPFYPEFVAMLAQYGVTVLDGKTVALERGGDAMTLAGYPCWDFSALAAPADIALYHDPEGFRLLETYGYGLVLSGHNHGGQIALPWGQAIIGPAGKLFPEYSYGLYEEGSSAMVLSRGLGTRGFPFRLFAMPEVVGVEFKAQA